MNSINCIYCGEGVNNIASGFHVSDDVDIHHFCLGKLLKKVCAFFPEIDESASTISKEFHCLE